MGDTVAVMAANLEEEAMVDISQVSVTNFYFAIYTNMKIFSLHHERSKEYFVNVVEIFSQVAMEIKEAMEEATTHSEEATTRSGEAITQLGVDMEVRKYFHQKMFMQQIVFTSGFRPSGFGGGYGGGYGGGKIDIFF